MPPVNGVLHIVTDKETLTDISKRTGVSTARIVSANGLKQPTVFVGAMDHRSGRQGEAGADGGPEAEARRPSRPPGRPRARPRRPRGHPSRRRSPSAGRRPAIRAAAGRGPRPGGHISQYYHYGHWAIDIADTYGAAVLAAKGGVVTFAGWKNNGGGWQVWISHGGNVYTTYNHMSSLKVGRGQYGRGRPARGADRRDRRRDGSPPALRGLDRPDLVRRHARQSTRLRLTRSRPA